MPLTGLAIGNGKLLVAAVRAGCGQESLLSWAAAGEIYSLSRASRRACNSESELEWIFICRSSLAILSKTVSYSMPTVERIDGGRQASGFAREACEDETAAGVAHQFTETEAGIT